MPLAAPGDMLGGGAALPFTRLGHGQFCVINSNTQWLLWASHKTETCSVGSVSGVVDPTCRTEQNRTEAGSQLCPESGV